MHPQLPATDSHNPLIAHFHHLVRHAAIHAQIKSLIKRTNGQQQLDPGQMHADTVSWTRAEGSVHELHCRCGGGVVFPTFRHEAKWLGKHFAVSLGCVG